MTRGSFAIAAAFVFAAACDPATSPDDDGDTAASGDTDTGGCTPTWLPGTPDPTNAAQWCGDFYTALCHRAFTDCTTELTVPAANEPACTTQMVGMCAGQDWSETVYVAADADYCLDIMTNAACSTFDDGGLEGCNSRIGLHGILPDPALCTEIGPGTHAGEITGTEPTYDAYTTLGAVGQGRPAKTFCLCLTAGEVLTASLAPGATNGLGAYPDLLLINPFGTIDTAGFLSGGDQYPTISAFTVGWTGVHMFVVTPQNPTGDTGTFDLTVTVN